MNGIKLKQVNTTTGPRIVHLARQGREDMDDGRCDRYVICCCRLLLSSHPASAHVDFVSLSSLWVGACSFSFPGFDRRSPILPNQIMTQIRTVCLLCTDGFFADFSCCGASFAFVKPSQTSQTVGASSRGYGLFGKLSKTQPNFLKIYGKIRVLRSCNFTSTEQKIRLQTQRGNS